jgi:2-(1,2-epoxy-1,2-dihydrophenyl)acetyl-CoA isomerase
MPTAALVATRTVIDASMQLDYADAISLEGQWQSRLSAAHDYLEGVAAFLAKRPATFTDR